MLLDQLRKALDKTGRPMGDIAASAGIHRVTLSRFKSGDRDFPVGTLEKVAKAIGYEVILRPARKSKEKT